MLLILLQTFPPSVNPLVKNENSISLFIGRNILGEIYFVAISIKKFLITIIHAIVRVIWSEF